MAFISRYVFMLPLALIPFASPAMADGDTVLWHFKGSPDGAGPTAGLMKFGRLLYGTTYLGGADNLGTVFSLDPASGRVKIVYDFQGGKDGASPSGGLIANQGILYGTTNGGGSGHGTVFSINPQTGAEDILYAFKGGKDGAAPYASLMAFHGKLYGTTANGGRPGFGTVFSVDPATGAEAVVYEFKGGSDGAYPEAGLITVNGKLYGTTVEGGAGGGTIFSLNPTNGNEKLVYSFQGGSDGSLPSGLLHLNSMLYGTTADGGSASCSSGCGTVFSFDPAADKETPVYAFQNGSDGATPLGGVIAVGGALIGTTQIGGDDHVGTVFSVDPATGAEAILATFQGGTDGANPYAGVTDVGGILYGTTQAGGGTYASCLAGSTGCGTVFNVTP